jgi:molybdenum cofactor cytidylyltransferase
VSSASPRRRVTGVLLAAGRSERFGTDKLAAKLPRAVNDVPLGTLVAVAAARQLVTAIPQSLAVVRPAAALLAASLRQEGLRVLPCPFADQGMAASLAFAIAASADADAWLVMLADMPWVRAATIARLASELAGGAALVVPVYQGKRGHPVGFAGQFCDELIALTGDVGARSILAAHAADVVQVEVDDPGILRDIDTPEDLARSPEAGSTR